MNSLSFDASRRSVSLPLGLVDHHGFLFAVVGSQTHRDLRLRQPEKFRLDHRSVFEP